MIDFLGIGAQKSGTTWLYSKLQCHPNIAFPAGKEVHFWDNNLDKGVDWYKEKFRKKKFRFHTMLHGEITPAYATLDICIIEKIYKEFPNLKIIIILRNPIDRAWSAALMSLNRAEMRIDEASNQWFIDHFRSEGSLHRGDYKNCILNWRKFFPLDQMLILAYEDIVTRPEKLLKECCDYLGLNSDYISGLPEGTLKERIFDGSGHIIRPVLLGVLHEIYDSKIIDTVNFLGGGFNKWIK